MPEDFPRLDPAAPGPASDLGEATDQYFAEVYSHLRALAGSYMRRERDGHTLQPTALVHEAYVRVQCGAAPPAVADQGHFLAIAARAMRQVLIDSARHRRADKRQGGQRVTLDEGLLGATPRSVDLIALDDALEDLAELDELRSRIVELRFFAGLSCADTADVLGMSSRTVVRQWRSSRAFLLRRIG